MREALSRTPDLERLASRIAMDRAHAKDLVSIRLALGSFEKVEAIAAGTFSSSPGIGAAAYLRLAELRKELEQAILDDPSILLSEGKLIKEGYSTELDALQHIQKDSRAVLEAYLEEEKTATGISSLKMRYNRLIGYFFEVTKTNLALVPPHFIRRQGIVGGERYSTEKLAGLEVEINEASGKVIELERKLFLALRDKLKTALVELLDASRRIAELDVYQSFARSATVRAWNKPSLDEHKRLRILEGRHPVVEEQLHRGQFVPNDLELDSKAVSFALITGPNMAGKSTYLRQAALITLMAQIGSFVPAREAEIGIVDRIFCRVGASDNLARGESTFLVEMNETANILRSATDRSLVIMDEVGRGTGTNDGLSIAWAICEDLLDNIGCRTLFASHYHELSSIVHPSLANRSMEVLEREGEIVFLRKLREGSALDSYGPHVARLAGVPERVVRRAEHILASLKANESKLHLEMDSPEVQEKLIPEPRSLDSKFLKALRSLDIEKTTPLEAFAFLSAWKEELSASIAKKKPLDHQIEKKKEGPSLFD
ncbi:hypothetical protein MASR2M78_16640 [Treponema sp.]